MKILLENGADVNAYGEMGNALQIASLWGRENIVSMLVKNGAVIPEGENETEEELKASEEGSEWDNRRIRKLGELISRSARTTR